MPSLLTAQECSNNVHLIVGTGPLAASRCIKSLEAGARPILVSPPEENVHFKLTKHLEDGKIRWTKREFEDDDLKTMGREEVDFVVDAVFVTYGPNHPLSVRISTLCKRWRIPVNVVDAPQLCTFTLLTTYTDGPLQIGITTSGCGCKLSSRIRREIAATFPPNFGQAVERLGVVRKRIWEEDKAVEEMQGQEVKELEVDDEDSENQKHTFNTLVKETTPDPLVARTRRMRWLSQICEYWPLKRLAAIDDSDISSILEAYKRHSRRTSEADQLDLDFSQTTPKRKGGIILAGSGPGHASMLTIATHQAIQSAHYILADKLVPAEILELIPRRTPVHIARKFPGNADSAQDEMHELALAAMKEGKTVLRLKQGDPYLYGRGAEEVMFFREHGYQATVLPGVTSALSGPLFAGIPVTHRSVADQVVVCTGTGRKGASPEAPSYRKGKTAVFLMALHRLESLVKDLSCPSSDYPERKVWPRDTPCAVVERASCPDQRVIRSTLEHICQAVEEEGSRPPGLLVVGWACAILHRPEISQRWKVEEGYRELDNLSHDTEEMRVLQTLSQDTSGEHGVSAVPKDHSEDKGLRTS